MKRGIQSLIPSRPTSDGDGVKIRRLSLFEQRMTDPFLMLDELVSDNEADYIGGFPPHPHRGMETLTYLKKGALIHQDHLGNRGEIRSGGAQWMSAGKGIIHSEMPELDMGGLHGFQLWINLPAKDKMSDPKYRDVPDADIVKVELENGIKVSAIAGEWQLENQTVNGPLDDLAASAKYLDVFIPAGATFNTKVENTDSVIAYLYEGELDIQPAAPKQTLIVFGSEGDELEIIAKEDSQLLLLAGAPIREPVAHYGPFVMNTVEEINEAIQDYNAGRFGG